MSANDTLREESWNHRGKRLMAAFAVLAVAVMVMGLTLTWFVGSQSTSTVAKVREPSKLRILGPNATTIEQVDLSYDTSNIDSDKKVTVRRGFCVESGGDPFELYVANTTNISGLTINVYRVTVNSVGGSGDVVESGSYSWSKTGDAIKFTFINKDSDSTSDLAETIGKGDPTFGDYTDVQRNAAPLYRYHAFATTDLDKDSSNYSADVTNFIIELTWTESVKETDIVYLIARNTTSG